MRDAADRDPMAWAGIIDAQSVKDATVDAATRGYDVGKRRNGHKPAGVVLGRDRIRGRSLQ